MWEWLREYGYDLEVLPYSEWRPLAVQVEPSNALFSVLPIILGEDQGEVRYPEEFRPRIDTTNSDRALAGSGIECPPISRELCWRALSYLIDVGFIDPPARADTRRGRAAEVARR